MIFPTRKTTIILSPYSFLKFNQSMLSATVDLGRNELQMPIETGWPAIPHSISLSEWLGSACRRYRKGAIPIRLAG